MKDSKLFTKTELAEVERRLKGEKKDYRIWYRAKPKLIEMIFWFSKIKLIKKIVGGKK